MKPIKVLVACEESQAVCRAFRARGHEWNVFDAMAYNLHELRGKDLACWCPVDGQPCHADVLLRIANE